MKKKSIKSRKFFKSKKIISEEDEKQVEYYKRLIHEMYFDRDFRVKTRLTPGFEVGTLLGCKSNHERHLVYLALDSMQEVRKSRQIGWYRLPNPITLKESLIRKGEWKPEGKPISVKTLKDGFKTTPEPIGFDSLRKTPPKAEESFLDKLRKETHLKESLARILKKPTDASE